MGIVYILNNPAFDNYVKIGRTIDIEQRMKQLDNTSVPLPFRCVFAVEVDDEVMEFYLEGNEPDIETLKKLREAYDEAREAFNSLMIAIEREYVDLAE